MNNESHSCGSRNPLEREKIDSHFRGNDNVVLCHSCPDNIGINYSRNTVDGERTDSHFRGNDNVVFCHSCPDNIGINYSRNPQVY